jgi:hypothetical protein
MLCVSSPSFVNAESMVVGVDSGPADFDYDDCDALNAWIVEASIKVEAAAGVLK